MDTEGQLQPHRLSTLESELHDMLKPSDDLERIRTLMARMGAMQVATKQVFISYPACNSNA